MATHVLPESASHSEQPLPARQLRGAPPRRWWKLGLLGIVVVAVVVSASTWIRHDNLPQPAGPRSLHTVTRGELLVTITEQGTLESSKNTEIKCTIRGGYGGRGGDSTVTWVIPAGTIVKTGDELVRLDTKVIEETVSLGRTDTNIAKAALARAKADLATAEVAVDAYLKGRYITQMSRLETRLAIANRNRLASQVMLRKSESLFRQGFVTQLEVEANRYTVRQAGLDLNVVETEIDVLSRLTKAMELETLNGQLIATKARLQGRKAGLELEQGRLDLAIEESDRSVIKAPQSGLVIYPSTAKWKDAPDVTVGANVHNNQVLLIMPDLAQMQVKIGIHESIIDRIKPGLTAKVTLPGKTLKTVVSTVAPISRPAGWWTGSVVKYDTILQLPSAPGLNPGMSAEVQVVVARYENVLPVPVAAVLETDEGFVCWVETAEGTERRSLKLGDSNDEFVVVENGLTDGEQVILHPLDSVEEARELVGFRRIHTIQRGDLQVTLTEQGALESSDNTLIKCRVRGSSTINWLIENGTQVKPGDELMRLENKQIEDFLHERTKFAYLSRDAAVGFRAHATRAGMAISEYLEGQYRTALLTLEKDLAIAEAQLRTSTNMLEHAQMMFANGYVSELEVEQKQITIRRIKAEVAIKKTEIDVLKRFTKDEQVTTLKGDWESAKAAANGHEEVVRMDEARMTLAEREIEQCVIKAPKSGLVIYPSTASWKDAPDIAEGATVHKNQVLLLMPDLTKMQVKVGIHESMVDRIKPGMPARVTLPGTALDGHVSFVASAAQPSGWWTGNIVKYDAIISLPSVAGLKPGMSAEVKVTMARHDNVLLIPLAAVVKTKQGYFCWVGTLEKAERRALEVGESSDSLLIIKSGLQEGEPVILDPRGSLEEAREEAP